MGRLGPQLEQLISSAVESKMEIIASAPKATDAILEKPWKSNLHIPLIGLQTRSDGPFMAHSTCCASDFLHPEFTRLCGMLALTPTYHRKYWEWVAILHHAMRTHAVGPSKRVLGFAVGTEPLPSVFAQLGARVTATDAPGEIGVGAGWQKEGQYASKLDDLYRSGVVARATFDERVSFSTCDMRHLPANMTGYDFCWSSCSFEHLGTLNAGFDFVVDSVETTLRSGGTACHTTELNVSSDTDTVESGQTVLYRRRDILELIDRLERRGHVVEPFSIAPDMHVLDFFVDTPPYSAPVHLKLQLLGYVSTSVALIIHRRG